jgi:hypothetical protein
LENFVAYKQRLQSGLSNKFLQTGLDDEVPVKDYSNTQYFVDVSVGSPA